MENSQDRENDKVLFIKIFCSLFVSKALHVGRGFTEDALQELAALAWQIWSRQGEAPHSAEVSWVLLVLCCGRPHSPLGDELGCPRFVPA